MVSTTAWQSTPAVKPGPTPMTTGASVMRVPRFRLARMASTTASGCKTGIAGPLRVRQHRDYILSANRAIAAFRCLRPAGGDVLHGGGPPGTMA